MAPRDLKVVETIHRKGKMVKKAKSSSKRYLKVVLSQGVRQNEARVVPMVEFEWMAYQLS